MTKILSDMNYKLALEVVRWVVKDENTILPNTDAIDWDELLSFCNRQGIIGLVFDKIKRSEIKMEQRQVFEWLSMSEMIKIQNTKVDKRIIDVVDFFKEKGYKSCILKGQANARMYPKPSLRSPGDIDIWVDGNVEEIISLVRSYTPEGHYSYHHIEFPLYKDVVVETHYVPAHLNNWITDNKLQKYIEEIKEQQFSNAIDFCDGEINCLTNEFNAVYLMLHMFGHFFSTRNSLKQLTDYFYLLKQGYSNQQKKEIANRFLEFGLLKFASGIMWIMKTVYGMEEELLLVNPNESLGKALMKETLHYGEKKKHNSIGVWTHMITSNICYLKYFSSQVMIAPLYLLWHQWWKFRMGIRLKQVKIAQ